MVFGSLGVFRDIAAFASSACHSTMGSTPSTAHRLAPSQSCICSNLTKNGFWFFGSFSRHCRLCVLCLSLDNGQYAEYSPSSRSLAELHMQQFDEKWFLVLWEFFETLPPLRPLLVTRQWIVCRLQPVVLLLYCAVDKPFGGQEPRLSKYRLHHGFGYDRGADIGA